MPTVLDSISIEFDKAPVKLKEAALKKRAAWIRILKAQAQVNLWQREVEKATQIHERADNEFATLLDNWDTESNSLNNTTPEELPVA